MRHGARTTYVNGGCRCTPCRQANREYQRKAGQSRAERLAADPSLAPHGSTSTYVNWSCRCPKCSTAWSRKQRRLYVERIRGAS
jgi:hypothetical protein